ncbi:DUF6452 family protein [Lutimonas sp.]|uniref:DUF6452 family protein n=1 Tax=Lutimonas sp. TaxID=1872403 RepID=UPI003D9B1362
MRKIYSSLFMLILLVIIPGCERDEICLEDITPKLIVRFYNNDIPSEVKSVINLKVEIEGIDGEYTNESISLLTDSIAIPLVVTENQTKFILTLQGDTSAGTEDNIDTLFVSYDQQDLFVSRSCGYKTVFNNANPVINNDNDNWMKELEITKDPLEIIDENKAHVKIYH